MRSPTSVVAKTTKLLGLTAAAALAVTGLGAGTANAAPLEAGSLECATVLQVEDGRIGVAVPEGKFQRDRDYPTAAEVAAMEKEFEARKRAMGLDDLEIRDPVVIPVWWHVIREGPTWEEGNLPRTQIRDQIRVLNHAYRGKGEAEPGARTPFKFELAGVTRTTNANWFNNADQGSVEAEMKSETRVGTAETLNQWSTNLLNVGLLGYATFPSSYEGNPELDGVVNTFQSLPGGDPDNTVPAYDEGDTATHEVGHWVGLFHTFQGGCGGNGDEVEDTPAEAVPYFGECPPGSEGPDTCAAPGDDPIENFMDYSDDVCMDRFTIGQRERSYEQYFTFRDGN